MKIRSLTMAGCVAAACVGLGGCEPDRKVQPPDQSQQGQPARWLIPAVPRAYHDEPIIIENGPVRIFFDPLRNPNNKGSLLPKEETFVKFESDEIKYVRVWNSEAPVPCGMANHCLDGNLWLVNLPVKIGLKDNTAQSSQFLTFNSAPEGESAHRPLAMKSETALEERGNDTTRIATKDKNLRVYSVQVQDLVTIYPHNPKNPTTPTPPAPNVSIRVQLCQSTKKCPDFADWP